jgi:hypothetical protein
MQQGTADTYLQWQGVIKHHLERAGGLSCSNATFRLLFQAAGLPRCCCCCCLLRLLVSCGKMRLQAAAQFL